MHRDKYKAELKNSQTILLSVRKLKFNLHENFINPRSKTTFNLRDKSIKQLKNNRAPGEDDIIAEIWKLREKH